MQHTAQHSPIWLQRIGKAKPALARHFSEAESVRQWLVMRALYANTSAQHQAATAKQLRQAFDQVAYGLTHGLILLDYVPETESELDIPNVDHAHYMQAMVYWSVRLNCTLSILSEAHARLGRRPSIQNTYAVVQRLEHEEAGRGRWAGTTRHPFASPPTMPMFENTRPQARAAN